MIEIEFVNYSYYWGSDGGKVADCKVKKREGKFPHCNYTVFCTLRPVPKGKILGSVARLGKYLLNTFYEEPVESSKLLEEMLKRTEIDVYNERPSWNKKEFKVKWLCDEKCFPTLGSVISNFRGKFREVLDTPRVRISTRGLEYDVWNCSEAEEALEDFLSRLPFPVLDWRLRIKVRAEEYEDLVYSLFAASPFIFGLGKGVNRGFGRFMPVKAKYDIESEEMVETLKALGERKVLRSVRRLEKVAEKYFNNYIERLGEEPRTSLFDFEEVGAYKNIGDAMKAIGNATLKVKWKVAAKLSPRAPGGNLHTWILGLPRGEGYALIHREGGRAEDTLCLSDEYVRETVVEESSLVIFPLPYLRNGILVMPSLKWLKYLDGVKRLYHVGKFEKEHAMSVTYIAKNRGSIKDPCGSKHEERGGVLFPARRVRYAEDERDLVRLVTDSALEFLKALLEG